MNKILLNALIALAGAALLLAGCSSVPTKVDSGPIKAATFSFIGGGIPAKAAFADTREQIHSMIQKALTANLAAKGLAKVATGGDVTVAYLVIVGNNASTESIDKYFGYGRDASALEDKAFKAYTSSKNPNYFQAGTLLIDFVDSKSFKLLRRTFVVRPVLGDVSAEVRAAHIQEAVDNALNGLRVVH